MQKLNWTAIIITVLIIIAVFGAMTYLYPRQASGRSVETTGTAQMTVSPDKAVVYAQIQTNGTTADQAKDANSEIQAEVLSALKKIGVEEKDIETENYNIYQNCEWTEKGQKCSGFIASNSLKINIKNFSITGKAVDAVVDNGALVSYINFELSTAKSNEYKALVLKMASEDAKIKADAVAAGQGRKVGKLVSISASEYNYYPYPLYRAEGAVSLKEAVATSIQPKNLDISATVSARYEIK